MKNNSVKIIRVTTIPESFILLKGQLKFLSKYYDIVAVSGGGEYLERTKEIEGVKTISLEMERKIYPIKDFISLMRMCFLLKKEKPTIIHSITPKAGLISMLAGKIVGVPIRIHTFTGLIFPTKTGLMQKLLIKTDQILCWASTDIYPEGQGVKRDLIDYNITKKQLKIIANGNVNGIDTAHFNSELFSKEKQQRLKTTLKIKEDDFVFIFVGRIVGDKGINELIKAFDKLSKTKDKIKLLLVGSFEDELDPLQEVTKNIINTNKQIISVGYQNDVRPYFSIADVLTFPSYREGFPNVVMQAGAMGLPSIVTNINGCNEIIEENKNGFIIPVKNSDALYEAMLKMMLNSDMKLKAREMITTRFEQKTVWDALLNEYKNSLLNNV